MAFSSPDVGAKNFTRIASAMRITITSNVFKPHDDGLNALNMLCSFLSGFICLNPLLTSIINAFMGLVTFASIRLLSCVRYCEVETLIVTAHIL